MNAIGQHMMHDNPSNWSRLSGRRPVELRGYALAEGLDVDVKVSDLSYDGCQIRSEHEFGIGDRFELRIIGRGGIDAEVRWVADECAGLRFDPTNQDANPQL